LGYSVDACQRNIYSVCMRHCSTLSDQSRSRSMRYSESSWRDMMKFIRNQMQTYIHMRTMLLTDRQTERQVCSKTRQMCTV